MQDDGYTERIVNRPLTSDFRESLKYVRIPNYSESATGAFSFLTKNGH